MWGDFLLLFFTLMCDYIACRGAGCEGIFFVSDSVCDFFFAGLFVLGCVDVVFLPPSVCSSLSMDDIIPRCIFTVFAILYLTEMPFDTSIHVSILCVCVYKTCLHQFVSFVLWLQTETLDDFARDHIEMILVAVSSEHSQLLIRVLLTRCLFMWLSTSICNCMHCMLK